jgi:hypothetical protein
MLVIHNEYQLKDADVKVSRILPRANWIKDNIEPMSKMKALLAAANDRKIAFHEERTARPQNLSHRSSMPGTSAGPSTVKKPKNAPQKKKTTQPQNTSTNYSSLPGTDAVPATTKDQKNAAQKKKTAAQPQKDKSHHISSSLPGTDAVPAAAAAKDQKLKPAPQKKRKGRPRNSNYSITPGYLYSDSDPMDYGMCDKDCGWCGRCMDNYSGNL